MVLMLNAARRFEAFTTRDASYAKPQLYDSLLSIAVADLRGRASFAPLPGPKFFHFHAVFGKINGSLAPPPLGNPGSATSYDTYNLLESIKPFERSAFREPQGIHT